MVAGIGRNQLATLRLIRVLSVFKPILQRLRDSFSLADFVLFEIGRCRSEKRETKAEKENKELRNEVERLKRELEKEKFKSNDYTYSKTADYDSEDPFADYLDEENPFEENPFTKCRTLYTTR